MKPEAQCPFDHKEGTWHSEAEAQAEGPKPSIGVLLVNLGSPDAPKADAVRRYLAQFLWDPRIVELPRPLWWLILHGIILRVRPKKSARKYAQIWRPEGSPLLQITKAQTQALRDYLAIDSELEDGAPLRVEYAMRYGNPSLASVVSNVLRTGVRKLLVVPLYPQYSATTTGSTMDALGDALKKERWLPELRFLPHYHDHPAYITACAEHIRNFQKEHGQPDRLVLSYHGIPQRYLEKGDPYHCECLKTSRLIAEALDLPPTAILTTFQSRFGREPWLQPYTDTTLKALPSQGVEHVQVFCPGFSADCLETLEEIDEENREYFLEAGGKRFDYIPALNERPIHIRALGRIVREQVADWKKSDLAPNHEAYIAYQRHDEA